jgi:hypothetical protein
MNYLNCTASPQSNSTALLDSGCTGHFLVFNAHCKGEKLAESPLGGRLPNDAIIVSTHTATLYLPSLPTAARQAHILPGVVQHSLLSVVHMCDSGCFVTFTSDNVTVKHDAVTILDGTCDPDSGFR